MLDKIKEIKKQMGDELLILAHHYQNDEIVSLADFVGDSLKLAQYAKENKKAKYIVFCGVYFMAETADILTEDYQFVFLPDNTASCQMAQMANITQGEKAYDNISEFLDRDIIPLTYVNSKAEIKAFCGEHNGSTLTSSNAKKVLNWALEQNKCVLFIPDRNLGRNTAYELGITDEEIAVYNPINETITPKINRDKLKIILWDGFCYVHNNILPEKVKKVRRNYPNSKVIVHPECKNEVVKMSDYNGSTEAIIKKIEEIPCDTWIVGTEKNLVDRLKNKYTDKNIVLLDDNSICKNMNLITTEKLLETLENIKDGDFSKQIKVEKKISEKAVISLNNMLSIK